MNQVKSDSFKPSQNLPEGFFPLCWSIYHAAGAAYKIHTWPLYVTVGSPEGEIYKNHQYWSSCSQGIYRII